LDEQGDPRLSRDPRHRREPARHGVVAGDAGRSRVSRPSRLRAAARKALEVGGRPVFVTADAAARVVELRFPGVDRADCGG
jgi:hypothetical protein